jgi:hypothetical protein
MIVIACHAAGAQTSFVPETLVDYRQHGANLVGARPSRSSLAETLRAGRDHVRRVRVQYELQARLRGQRPLLGWALYALLARALLPERALSLPARLRLLFGYAAWW